ncbi:MAG: MFS transporter [Chloroflexi bacterium]|nr:MFS transporter [Chloroflexota bacterium]
MKVAEEGRTGRTFAALRTRNYRLYFAGQLVSQVGSWMQRLAQAWLVLDLSDSPLALGTVTALQVLPILAFSLVGGVLADRWPKRSFLFFTQSLQMLQALALGVLALLGWVQLWHLYVFAASLGVTHALDQPARRAMPAELVPRVQLPSAVALDSTIFNAARVVGPALGGLAITAVGVGGCFLLNGASFVAVLSALALMRPAEMAAAPPPARTGAAQQVREGLAFAWRTPDIVLTLLLLGMLGTFGYNFSTVLPLLARYQLDAGALGFGGLNSALGLGSVAGSLFVAGQRGAYRRRMLWAAAGIPALLAAQGISSQYEITLALLFGQGIVGVIFSATANTNLQLLTPHALRGRVLSLYTLLFVGATPLGATFIGSVTDRWGLTAALSLAAAGCALGLAAGLLYVRSTHAREHRDIPQQGSAPLG